MKGLIYIVRVITMQVGSSRSHDVIAPKLK